MEKASNMRLTQLIFNAIPTKEPCPHVFYMEDSKLIKHLKDFILSA